MGPGQMGSGSRAGRIADALAMPCDPVLVREVYSGGSPASASGSLRRQLARDEQASATGLKADAPVFLPSQDASSTKGLKADAQAFQPRSHGGSDLERWAAKASASRRAGLKASAPEFRPQAPAPACPSRPSGWQDGGQAGGCGGGGSCGSSCLGQAPQGDVAPSKVLQATATAFQPIISAPPPAFNHLQQQQQLPQPQPQPQPLPQPHQMQQQQQQVQQHVQVPQQMQQHEQMRQQQHMQAQQTQQPQQPQQQPQQQQPQLQQMLQQQPQQQPQQHLPLQQPRPTHQLQQQMLPQMQQQAQQPLAPRRAHALMPLSQLPQDRQHLLGPQGPQAQQPQQPVGTYQTVPLSLPPAAAGQPGWAGNAGSAGPSEQQWGPGAASAPQQPWSQPSGGQPQTPVYSVGESFGTFSGPGGDAGARRPPWWTFGGGSVAAAAGGCACGDGAAAEGERPWASSVGAAGGAQQPWAFDVGRPAESAADEQWSSDRSAGAVRNGVAWAPAAARPGDAPEPAEPSSMRSQPMCDDGGDDDDEVWASIASRVDKKAKTPTRGAETSTGGADAGVQGRLTVTSSPFRDIRLKDASESNLSWRDAAADESRQGAASSVSQLPADRSHRQHSK
ncbi:unnamed protein product, partial [Prorocentrum cordatum]